MIYARLKLRTYCPFTVVTLTLLATGGVTKVNEPTITSVPRLEDKIAIMLVS
jgi:hypothetical protein